MATKSTISQNAVKLQEELNSEYLNSIKHEKDLLELARNRGKALVEILTSKEELNKLTEQEIEDKNAEEIETCTDEEAEAFGKFLDELREGGLEKTEEDEF